MARWLSCAVAAVSSLLIGSGQAGAAVYDWTASIPFDGSHIDGAGQLTTQDTLTGGGYLVTGINGTYGNATIVGLLPVNSQGGNDNLVFTSYPQVDFDGVAFSVNVDPGGLEGSQVNIYYVASAGYTDDGYTGYNPSGFTLTLAQTVPEPATGMMIGVGIIGLGLLRRNRSR